MEWHEFERHFHLSAAERQDIFDVANECLEAIDTSMYDDCFTITVLGFRNAPQVLVMPLRWSVREWEH